MTLWKLKGCPRCGGDLNYIQRVVDVPAHYSCIDCGYVEYAKFKEKSAIELKIDKEIEDFKEKMRRIIHGSK